VTIESESAGAVETVCDIVSQSVGAVYVCDIVTASVCDIVIESV
jgi:hypothetical protein